MSHKIDDSDQRLRSLEGKVRAQELTIKNLEKQVNSASSLHRYLQEADTDCLPTFVNSSFGPRCDFRYVTRFQDRTIFNDGVVFNENVEFDSDANCMPTYNSTTRMCMLNNNFTFDEGDIIFDFNVRFDEDVRFNDDVAFRDPVFLIFDDEGKWPSGKTPSSTKTFSSGTMTTKWNSRSKTKGIKARDNQWYRLPFPSANIKITLDVSIVAGGAMESLCLTFRSLHSFPQFYALYQSVDS